MKTWLNHTAMLLCLLSPAFISSPSAAEGLQLGARVGYFNIEFDQLDHEESFLATAVQIGYEYLSTNRIVFAAETEFTSSLTEGKVDGEQYSYNSIGAYATLRTRGNTFFIGRLGVLESNIDFRDRESVEPDATVIGIGIGFGQNVRREIKLDSIQYDDQSALFLSFGLGF